MQNNDVKFDLEMEKRVESFAVETIKDVENKSKMLITTVGEITDVSHMRK